MTTKTERLAEMYEMALDSVANELSGMVQAEHLLGIAAVTRDELRVAERHYARATAFLEATRVIYRVISEIENEVNRDDTGN